jgi:hypothetical protein
MNLFGNLTLQALDDGYVFESGNVAGNFTGANQLFQETAHDFPRASLWQTDGEM